MLKDPDSYVAHNLDLLEDRPGREYWLGLFAEHFEHTLESAATQYGRGANRRIISAREQFARATEPLRDNPGSLPGGRLDVIELCRLREKVLRANRLNDPFGYVKARENASAAKLYPDLARRLHAMDSQARWLRLIESVFAGNMFDLGSSATMHLTSESTDFMTAVDNIRPRPWCVDDFDRFAEDLPDGPPTPWSKAVIFVDNAGSDFILGVMPLARELAMNGTKVVLAANELPTLNDITADETVLVVEQLAAADPDLAAMVGAGMFEVVSTGNDIPLIDLSQVSDELNEASADAELLILEGMGRAVESNFDGEFTVDTLRLALLKDPAIAKLIDGDLFDCVCKYTPKT